MIRILQILIAVMLAQSISQSARADDVSDALFQPSFSNMMTGASAFAHTLINYHAFQQCASDPSCGMPDDPGSGFEVGAGSCCDNNDECFNDFSRHVNRIDRALFTLYSNDRRHNLVMRIQGARMAAMRGAGGSAAPAAAVVARQEADIAIAERNYLEKYNAKTNEYVGLLNDFLLELGSVINSYCEGSDWYQRNGLPLYLHAKIKFPK